MYTCRLIVYFYLLYTILTITLIYYFYSYFSYSYYFYYFYYYFYFYFSPYFYFYIYLYFYFTFTFSTIFSTLYFIILLFIILLFTIILLLFILFIVRCGSLMGPCRLLAITRKILLQPIWRQKPCECMGKRPCLRLTPRQGKTHILSSSCLGYPYRGLPAHALLTYLQGITP